MISGLAKSPPPAFSSAAPPWSPARGLSAPCQFFPRTWSNGQEVDMRGVITGKDVLWHSLTIVRHFGPRCYLRCLRAALSSTPSTFLAVVCAQG